MENQTEQVKKEILGVFIDDLLSLIRRFDQFRIIDNKGGSVRHEPFVMFLLELHRIGSLNKIIDYWMERMLDTDNEAMWSSGQITDEKYAENQKLIEIGKYQLSEKNAAFSYSSKEARHSAGKALYKISNIGELFEKKDNTIAKVYKSLFNQFGWQITSMRYHQLRNLKFFLNADDPIEPSTISKYCYDLISEKSIHKKNKHNVAGHLKNINFLVQELAVSKKSKKNYLFIDSSFSLFKALKAKKNNQSLFESYNTKPGNLALLKMAIIQNNSISTNDYINPNINLDGNYHYAKDGKVDSYLHESGFKRVFHMNAREAAAYTQGQENLFNQIKEQNQKLFDCIIYVKSLYNTNHFYTHLKCEEAIIKALFNKLNDTGKLIIAVSPSFIINRGSKIKKQLIDNDLIESVICIDHEVRLRGSSQTENLNLIVINKEKNKKGYVKFFDFSESNGNKYKFRLFSNTAILDKLKNGIEIANNIIQNTNYNLLVNRQKAHKYKNDPISKFLKPAVTSKNLLRITEAEYNNNYRVKEFFCINSENLIEKNKSTILKPSRMLLGLLKERRIYWKIDTKNIEKLLLVNSNVNKLNPTILNLNEFKETIYIRNNIYPFFIDSKKINDQYLSSLLKNNFTEKQAKYLSKGVGPFSSTIDFKDFLNIRLDKDLPSMDEQNKIVGAIKEEQLKLKEIEKQKKELEEKLSNMILDKELTKEKTTKRVLDNLDHRIGGEIGKIQRINLSLLSFFDKTLDQKILNKINNQFDENGKISILDKLEIIDRKIKKITYQLGRELEINSKTYPNNMVSFLDLITSIDFKSYKLFDVEIILTAEDIDIDFLDEGSDSGPELGKKRDMLYGNYHQKTENYIELTSYPTKKLNEDVDFLKDHELMVKKQINCNLTLINDLFRQFFENAEEHAFKRKKREELIKEYKNDKFVLNDLEKMKHNKVKVLINIHANTDAVFCEGEYAVFDEGGKELPSIYNIPKKTRANNYLEIQIRDNGLSFPEEMTIHNFLDPNYSSKKIGGNGGQTINNIISHFPGACIGFDESKTYFGILIPVL